MGSNSSILTCQFGCSSDGSGSSSRFDQHANRYKDSHPCFWNITEKDENHLVNINEYELATRFFIFLCSLRFQYILNFRTNHRYHCVAITKASNNGIWGGFSSTQHGPIATTLSCAGSKFVSTVSGRVKGRVKGKRQ